MLTSVISKIAFSVACTVFGVANGAGLIQAINAEKPKDE